MRFDGLTMAFQTLKEALITASVLIFPDFSATFVVETDACDVRVGAVLSQKEHPIAYYSKKLSLLQQRASTYSKKLWAITDSIHKWRHHLLGSTFVMRIGPIIGV